MAAKHKLKSKPKRKTALLRYPEAKATPEWSGSPSPPRDKPKQEPEAEAPEQEHDREEQVTAHEQPKPDYPPDGGLIEGEAHEHPVTTGRAALGYPSPTDPDHPERGVTDDPSQPGYQPPDEISKK